MAAFNYATDNDNVLPPADNQSLALVEKGGYSFAEMIAPYAGDTVIFSCPAQNQVPVDDPANHRFFEYMTYFYYPDSPFPPVYDTPSRLGHPDATANHPLLSDRVDYWPNIRRFRSRAGRGRRTKRAESTKPDTAAIEIDDEDTPYRKLCSSPRDSADVADATSFGVSFCRMPWAALIQRVYEVDPLHCPKCADFYPRVRPSLWISLL